MTLTAIKSDLNGILKFRSLFLQENNFQIRYNACHERGWTDSYILTCGEQKIGYGSIKGNENRDDRDTVFEFYILPPFRRLAPKAFSELLRSSGAVFIECQSNDLMLTSLLYQFAGPIQSDTILFEENTTTSLRFDIVIFRKRLELDVVFEHKAEPVGDYVLELDKKVVATGGFLLHYNPPFADLYMEVHEGYRRKGLGGFLVQEVKKQCYLSGRVPAARCSIDNVASKSTLIKAGFGIAGFMLLGKINNAPLTP